MSDITKLEEIVEVLSEIEEMYGGRTLDNIIQDISAKIRFLKNIK